MLKEKGCTIEMLLDEDEIVVEAKKGRDDLLQLYVLATWSILIVHSLTQPDNLRKLIGYIVDEAPASADEKVRMRYCIAVCHWLWAIASDLKRVAFLPSFNLVKSRFFQDPSVNLLKSC